MFDQRITGQCARILTFVVAVQYAQDRNARGARPARRWSSRRPSMSGLALLATMRRRIARVADPACAAFTSLLQRSVMIKETLHRGSMRRLVQFAPWRACSWFDQHRCAPADHVTHVGRRNLRPSIFSDGSIQGQRDIADGIE